MTSSTFKKFRTFSGIITMLERCYDLLTRKLCYRKDGHAMRLIYECPESFCDSLNTPVDTLPKLFWSLLFWSTLWMCIESLKCVALAVLR